MASIEHRRVPTQKPAVQYSEYPEMQRVIESIKRLHPELSDDVFPLFPNAAVLA
jgi:hypothetical protein